MATLIKVRFLCLAIGTFVPFTYISLAPLSAEMLPKPDDRLLAIAEASLKNRSSFTLMDCRFELSHGAADNIEDAMKGRVSAKFASGKVHWVSDGTNLLFDVKYESHQNLKSDGTNLVFDMKYEPHPDVKYEPYQNLKEEKRAGPIDELIPSSPTSFWLLRDKNTELYFDGGARVCSLGTESPSPISGTPFDFALMGENDSGSPANLILRASELGKEGAMYEYTESVEVAGQKLTEVKIHYHNSGLQLTYLLDGKRGFLPTQMKITDTAKRLTVASAYLLEAKECTGGRWFPMRWVSLAHPGNKSESRFAVTDCKVTDLDVDRKPLLSSFVVQVPKGARVNNGKDPGSQFAVDSDLTVTPDKLSALLDKTASALTRRALAPKNAAKNR